MPRRKSRLYRKKNRQGVRGGHWYGWYQLRSGHKAIYVCLYTHDRAEAEQTHGERVKRTDGLTGKRIRKSIAFGRTFN